MKLKDLKNKFTESMGESIYWFAKGKYSNTLLKDIPIKAREYMWNIAFYSYPMGTARKELFTAFNYKDLRYED